jgi:hypothetical protein
MTNGVNKFHFNYKFINEAKCVKVLNTSIFVVTVSYFASCVARKSGARFKREFNK